MTEKSCTKCFYAHANCGDSSIACDSEEAVCDTYLGIERIENSVINRVLRIIDDEGVKLQLGGYGAIPKYYVKCIKSAIEKLRGDEQ